jgi:hypothetical protein
MRQYPQSVAQIWSTKTSHTSVGRFLCKNRNINGLLYGCDAVLLLLALLLTLDGVSAPNRGGYEFRASGIIVAGYMEPAVTSDARTQNNFSIDTRVGEPLSPGRV